MLQWIEFNIVHVSLWNEKILFQFIFFFLLWWCAWKAFNIVGKRDLSPVLYEIFKMSFKKGVVRLLKGWWGFLCKKRKQSILNYCSFRIKVQYKKIKLLIKLTYLYLSRWKHYTQDTSMDFHRPQTFHTDTQTHGDRKVDLWHSVLS